MILKIKRVREEDKYVYTIIAKIAKPCPSDSNPSSNLKLDSGSFYLPKKSRGDDAHFVSHTHQTVGVADGVGGWSKIGVDAGNFARELMMNAHGEVESSEVVDPRKVLNEAFLKTKAEGSSTACVLTLKDSSLIAVNVGDSGFMVLREKKLMYRSPPQQHRFNYPYQLGKSEKSDRPQSALHIEVGVMAGDVVIVGTDGLWDNIHPTQIEYILMRAGDDESCCAPKEIAERIGAVAFFNSRNKDYDSPFAIASRKAGRNHKGGKKDDITVLVAFVKSSVSHP
ncbi:probable protein phosphatase 2C 80 [Carica papaya]|uniref:probable protein phosphatase 2C 80 n=1 Tax=Carica papaya TaxID=3649 RepID=UPI000B8C84E3|nr:probable protein phosphatase 2C 80 [Carica papaya]